jgi:lantibiotic protection ABC transporter MutE/EpiE family permease subunit
VNALYSELIKYKRTFTQKLIILFPLFFVLQALPQKLFMEEGFLRPWQQINNLVFNWWPLIFLPLGIALFSVLVDSQERKAGNYRALRAHPMSPARIWVNKILGMVLYTLLATFVLIISVVLAGLITARGDVPWSDIIIASFIAWVTSLAFIPLQLWASTWKGLFFSMGLGFVGMLVGVSVAVKSFWMFIPWSWPIRLMSPIIGVHPNGVTLEAGDPLLDSSVIPTGIMISLIVFVVLTIITAFWFKQREVK